MMKRVFWSVLVLIFFLASQTFAAEKPLVLGLETDGKGSILESVQLLTDKENIQLEMRFDGEIAYTSVIWENPCRIVIDVQNGSYRNWFTQLDKKDWLFQQVRIFKNRFGLRIIVELKLAGPNYRLNWDAAEKVLRLTVPRRFTVVSTAMLAEGVEYVQIQRGLSDGVALVQALDITVPQVVGRKFYSQIGKELLLPALQLKTVYRVGGLIGLSKVSDLVRQEGGLAGMNGGFFNGDGSPLGLLIQDGNLVSQPLYNRTAWGIDEEGRMRMEAVDLLAEVIIKDQVVPLSGFNRIRSADELIAYSPDFGKSTRTNEWGREVVIKNQQVVAIRTNDSPIPPDGWVISGHGKYKALLESLQIGDRVEVKISLTPDWLSERVQYGVGGGPRLLKDGEIFISGAEERFQSDILVGRAPRTALGITPENHLWMVVVDGRSEISAGMSLQELAELMQDLGASDAMNLDGGKSSTLVIKDQVRNVPSSGKEIPVHNGLILLIDLNRKLLE